MFQTQKAIFLASWPMSNHRSITPLRVLQPGPTVIALKMIGLGLFLHSCRIESVERWKCQFIVTAFGWCLLIKTSSYNKSHTNLSHILKSTCILFSLFDFYISANFTLKIIIHMSYKYTQRSIYAQYMCVCVCTHNTLTSKKAKTKWHQPLVDIKIVNIAIVNIIRRSCYL